VVLDGSELSVPCFNHSSMRKNSLVCIVQLQHTGCTLEPLWISWGVGDQFLPGIKHPIIMYIRSAQIMGARLPWWQFCVVAPSFEVATRFFENLCTPDVHWIYMWWESKILLVAIWGATYVLGPHYSYGWKLCRTHFTHRSCFSL